MKNRASIPIHKRWPERFAMRLTLYRKAGGGKDFAIETDLTDEEKSLLANLLVRILHRGTREERAVMGDGGEGEGDEP
jgi:hypothetical protein